MPVIQDAEEHSVRQRVLPILEFAETTRTYQDFAERVDRFEQVFGKADSDTLSVLAQASFFCWFEVEYRQDYTNVCRAIGMGRPTSVYLCRQVTPQRWTEMNAYVIGVQRWLGVERPLYCDIPKEKLSQIDEWLGRHSTAKEALAELFLCHLSVDLLQLSLAKLSGRVDPEEKLYFDFTPWYVRRDGTEFSSENYASLVEQLSHNARQEVEVTPKDAEKLISGISMESQPACHHRFSRYQDVKISSIGALEWRGNVPADVDVPKYESRNWFEQDADLEGWLSGKPAVSDLQAKLYAALGTPTEKKRAIVRNFFYGPPLGPWLVAESAKQDGITVADIFGGV